MRTKLLRLIEWLGWLDKKVFMPQAVKPRTAAIIGAGPALWLLIVVPLMFGWNGWSMLQIVLFGALFSFIFYQISRQRRE